MKRFTGIMTPYGVMRIFLPKSPRFTNISNTVSFKCGPKCGHIIELSTQHLYPAIFHEPATTLRDHTSSQHRFDVVEPLMLSAVHPHLILVERAGYYVPGTISQ
jgi:hypothetical protein